LNAKRNAAHARVFARPEPRSPSSFRPAAVVDEDQFAVDAAGVQNFGHRRVQQGKVFFLVVNGNADGKGRLALMS
jgi:hypothetical protein